MLVLNGERSGREFDWRRRELLAFETWTPQPRIMGT